MRSLLIPLVAGLLAGCFAGSTASDTAEGAATDVASAEPAQSVTVMRRWPDPASDTRPVPQAPNVVLVILCTWRADQLAPWGGPAESAPTLAQLAATGVVFDTAIGQAPWTRPASAAILTGRFPTDIGMTEPGPGPNHRAVAPGVSLLSERLHEAGWSTVGVVANPNLNSVWGFDQGFDSYVEMSGTLGDASTWRASGGRAVVERALSELSERPDPARPVFVELVLTDAHSPLRPPADEVARFAGPDVPDLLARYRASLRRGDLAVAQLLEGLAAARVDPSNTLVVLAADHGEGLSLPPSHGPHHGLMLYPSTVHVPVVLSGPGVGQGRIGGITTQLDITPTVLGLLGLPSDDEVLAGEDLSDAARAGTGQAGRKTAFTSTRFRWADRSAAYTAAMQCQIDDAAKLSAQAISGGDILPFDTSCCRWREDPACERPEWDAELLDSLRSWRASRDRAARGFQAVEAEPNAVIKEQLQALGYVE